MTPADCHPNILNEKNEIRRIIAMKTLTFELISFKTDRTSGLSGVENTSMVIA